MTLWNLIPRRADEPWTCTRHGAVRVASECTRCHAGAAADKELGQVLGLIEQTPTGGNSPLLMAALHDRRAARALARAGRRPWWWRK